jgi:phenylacetate-CoA ligase
MPKISDRIYRKLPVFAQNLAISAFGVRYKRERLGGAFEEHVQGFRERDRWDAELMNRYLERSLRKLLAHAFEECPYYRARWRTAGLRAGDLANFSLEDLQYIPILPKDDVRRNPRALLAQSSVRQKLHAYQTSGSTGTPITCFLTDDTHRRLIAAREVRSFGWAGASVKMPRSMIGGRVVVPARNGPPYYRYNLAERQVYFSAFHIGPDQLASYMEGFRRHRPQLLTGYSHAYYHLARLMEQRGLQLDYEPKAAVLSSEKLTAEMKETIKRSFRTRAFEEYGSVENCGLATECEYGNLHINPDFGIIEIVDDSGKPLPNGEAGAVLCTGLLNTAQPLIRYRIGDIGMLSRNGCACGRNQLPVLAELVGRLEDAVITPDGRRVSQFYSVFWGLPNVVEAQVVQDRVDGVTVRVVAMPGFSAKEERLIRERMCADRLGSMHIRIERVPVLERTERGKFRAVVNLVADRAGARRTQPA